MISYSIPRRIWRVIYPPLLFLAIQFASVLLIGVCAAVIFTMREIVNGLSTLDALVITDAVLQFLAESTMLVVLISNAASLGVFIPMWMRTRKWNDTYSNSEPFTLGLLVAGFFAGFNVVQMMVFGLTDIMKYFPSYEEVTDLFVSGSLLLQIVTVGVAAPIVEELLFRGILINRMKGLPAWASVIIQALLFGIVHLNMFQSLYAFVAGLLLGWAYVRYRSIIIVIIGHMAYNLISIMLSEFLDEKSAVFFLLLSFAVAAVCTLLLIRRPAATAAVQLEDGEAQEEI